MEQPIRTERPAKMEPTYMELATVLARMTPSSPFVSVENGELVVTQIRRRAAPAPSS